MVKAFTVILVSAGVLSAGLASCSPEKKTRDVYQAPPPVIEDGGERTGLKDWNSRRSKRLDLRDSFDFSAAAPARMQIGSQCRSGGESSYATIDFTGQERVQIWQTLPEELLTAAIHRGSVQCDWEFDLFNASGSNHIFTLTSIPLADERDADVRLDAGPSGPLRVRYDNRSNGAAAAVKLECTDFRSRPLPFSQVVDFSHIDLGTPELRAGRDPDVLDARPLQYCRAVITENGQPTALSGLFPIVLPRAPLEVQSIPAPIRELPRLQVPDALHGIFVDAKPILFSVWQVTNRDTFARFLRIPKRHFAIAVNLAYYDYSGPAASLHKMTFSLAALGLSASGAAAVVRDDEQFTWLQLPARSGFRLEAWFHPPGHVCKVPPPLWGATVSAAETLIIDETLDSGEVVSTTPLEFGEITLSQGGPSFDAIPRAAACGWN